MTPQLRFLSALLLGALLASSPALAAPAAEGKAAHEPSADGKVTLSFRGTLRDALQAIAKQSGVNVVATGPLDTEVEVHLQAVDGEQALRTLARAYDLDVEEEGGMWVLHANEAEPSASRPRPSAALPPLPPLAPLPPPAPRAPHAPTPLHAPDTDDPDDVEVFGRNHTVEEDDVVEDVVVTGGNLTVNGEVQKDAAVVGGNMTVNGTVAGDAVATGGNLYINGHVQGDAHAFGGNVDLGESAVVDGDVSSFGGKVHRAEGAQVGGKRESFRLPRRHLGGDHDEGGVAPWLGNLIIRFALMFGLGFAFLMFAPSRMKQLGEEMLAQPVACGLTGMLSAVALLPLCILLCVTIIGIPVFLALLVIGPVGVAMGVTALANELGARLPVLRGRKTQAVVLALGTGLLMVLFSLPKLGWLALVAALMLSLGALVRTRFGNRPRGMPESLRPATAGF